MIPPIGTARLYSALEASNAKDAKDSLSVMPDAFKHRVYHEVWSLAGGRHDAGDRWGEYHAADDLSRLKTAVDRALQKLVLEEISEGDRNEVFGRVYDFAYVVTEDEKWGEHHAFDNMARLARAVDAVGYCRRPPFLAPGHKAVHELRRTLVDSSACPYFLSYRNLSREAIDVNPTSELRKEIAEFLRGFRPDIEVDMLGTLRRFEADDFDYRREGDILSSLHKYFALNVLRYNNPRLNEFFDCYERVFEKNERTLFPYSGGGDQCVLHWKAFYSSYKHLVKLDLLNTTVPVDLTNVQSYYAILGIGEIASPSLFGLELLACHYEVKYGINLYVETKEFFEKKLKEGIYPKDFPFGVIFTGHNQHAGHVTPRIISYNSSNFDGAGGYDILNLDSAESETKILSLSLPEAIEGINFRELKLLTQRQADRSSCRNDAVVILAHALFDLRERNERDIFKYTREAKYFPAPWAKTAQTSLSLEKTDTSAPVRTKRGTVPLSAFIDRYVTRGMYELIHGGGVRNYLLYKGYKMAGKIKELIENRENYKEVWSRVEARRAAALTAAG